MMSLLPCASQTIGRIDSNSSYVFSEQGFVHLEGTFKYRKITFKFRGLYTPDGKTLVHNGGKIIKTQDPPVVAPGTEEIASGACLMDGVVYIPNTVKKIGIGAFGATTSVYVYDVNDISDLKKEE